MQQGLYNVTEQTKTAANATTWIQPGIHENLKLVDIKYDISKNGKEYLAFYVENEQGDTVSCTEWQYIPTKSFEEMDAKEKEKTLSIIENQKSKIKQIVEVFKPNFNITASSFKEFAEKTIVFLGDSYKNTSLRLKVVFDRRGWTTFGQSSKNIFIEPMSVSKEDSKIRILISDTMVRPATPEREAQESNPLEDTDISKNPTEDDLPF